VEFFSTKPDAEKIDAELRKDLFYRWQLRLFPVLAEHSTNALVDLMQTRTLQLRIRRRRERKLFLSISWGNEPPKSLKTEIMWIRIMCVVATFASCFILYPAAIILFVILAMANGGKPPRLTGNPGAILGTNGYQRDALVELWLAGLRGREFYVGTILMGARAAQAVTRSWVCWVIAAIPFLWAVARREFAARSVTFGDSIARFIYDPADLTIIGPDAWLVVVWCLLGIILLRSFFYLIIPWALLSGLPYIWGVRELWKPGGLVNNSARFLLKTALDGIGVLVVVIPGSFVTMLVIDYYFNDVTSLVDTPMFIHHLRMFVAMLAGSLAGYLVLTLMIIPLVRWRLRNWMTDELDEHFDHFMRRVVIEDPDWDNIAPQASGSDRPTT